MPSLEASSALERVATYVEKATNSALFVSACAIFP
jgi:hypothetical protein